MFTENVQEASSFYSGDHPLIYDQITREVGIRLNESSSYVVINYCPWCGESFPVSLREEMFRQIRETLGTDDFEFESAPPEFHTDAWWRVRGL
jgi:hypothetical protein